MPITRTARSVTTSLLCLALLVGPAHGAAGAADPQPPAEVARFRQGERDFANRHGSACAGIPAYGEGPCATRRRT